MAPVHTLDENFVYIRPLSTEELIAGDYACEGSYLYAACDGVNGNVLCYATKKEVEEICIAQPHNWVPCRIS
jgi:hypothetical protein